MITIRVDAERVMVGLKRLGTALPDIAEKRMTKVMARIRKVVSGGWPGQGNGLGGAASGSYTVPERPGQTYVRTGNYGRSVYVEKYGLSYKVHTAAYSKRGYNYGPRLTGPGQAWWAQGRWPDARIEAENEASDLVQDLDKDFAKGAEAAGL